MSTSKYSICYFIPYFGKLPQGFPMWLLSCSANKTVNWILMTDDKTEYHYPPNVRVIYCSFEDVKKRIQKFYSFPIVLDRPWKLCDYRPAYGEIFADELSGYDFWGHCDMDLIWGDIRQFITDDILDQYDKIGFQGHSTLYRNTSEVNARYQTVLEGELTYQDIFQSSYGHCFDEDLINKIYQKLNIQYYTGINFAHFDPLTNSFFLEYFPVEDNYKNRRQVFVWEDGKIKRYYLHNKIIYSDEEFMYLHTFKRPIVYKADNYAADKIYVMYPDVLKEIRREDLTYNFINRKGKCSALRYYVTFAYNYRKKLTIKNVIGSFLNKTKRAIKRGKRY